MASDDDILLNLIHWSKFVLAFHRPSPQKSRDSSNVASTFAPVSSSVLQEQGEPPNTVCMVNTTKAQRKPSEEQANQPKGESSTSSKLASIREPGISVSQNEPGKFQVDNDETTGGLKPVSESEVPPQTFPDISVRLQLQPPEEELVVSSPSDELIAPHDEEVEISSPGVIADEFDSDFSCSPCSGNTQSFNDVGVRLKLDSPDEGMVVSSPSDELIPEKIDAEFENTQAVSSIPLPHQYIMTRSNSGRPRTLSSQHTGDSKALPSPGLDSGALSSEATYEAISPQPSSRNRLDSFLGPPSLPPRSPGLSPSLVSQHLVTSSMTSSHNPLGSSATSHSPLCKETSLLDTLMMEMAQSPHTQTAIPLADDPSDECYTDMSSISYTKVQAQEVKETVSWPQSYLPSSYTEVESQEQEETKAGGYSFVRKTHLSSEEPDAYSPILKSPKPTSAIVETSLQGGEDNTEDASSPNEYAEIPMGANREMVSPACSESDVYMDMSVNNS